jgi:hypothetical protein
MDRHTDDTSRRRPTRGEIERRAYERFVGRGAVHGGDVADWLEAERELLASHPTDREFDRIGISNRESAGEEEAEREQFRRADSSPQPQDAAGRIGEQPLQDLRDRHTSHKAGSRSMAQKEAESRYADRSMPATRKVAGAFGKEPQDVGKEYDREGSLYKR